MKASCIRIALAFVATMSCGAWASEPTVEDSRQHESSAGVIVTSGNAPTQSVNLKHVTQLTWEPWALKLQGIFTRSSNRDTLTARQWSLGARGERMIFDSVAIFVGETIESNIFAGFLQRYNTDAGLKISLMKVEKFHWWSEAGYQYSLENRLAGQLAQSYLRFFTGIEKSWSESVTGSLGVEFLPNLTVDSDYQLNGELAISAAMSEMFAIKTGYAIKYRNVPVAPATGNTDSTFTTALVAKY